MPGTLTPGGPVLSALILAVVILLTLGTATKRMLDLNRFHPLAVVVMLMAAASPSWVAYQVLEPGEPVDSATVRRHKDVVTLEIPEGYAIMATANLSEETGEPNTDKTAYAFEIQGDGWGHTEAGTFKRRGAGGGPDVDVYDGHGVQDSTTKRSGGLGEDLQDRIDPLGTGKATITVKNWQGAAALSVDLDVVKGPPPAIVVWGIAILIAILGIIIEVRFEADKVAGDVAFLGLWAVFLRDGVTPLDDFQGVATAVLPAALLGWGAVGGLAWLADRYVATSGAPDEPEPEPEPEAEEEPETAPEELGPRARRRARRRGEPKS